MVKKINEKTAGISLAGFQARPAQAKSPELSGVVDGQPPSPTPSSGYMSTPLSASKSFSVSGIFMSAITGKDEISKQLAYVKGK